MRFAQSVLATTFVAAALVASAGSAAARPGADEVDQVVAFSHEFTPLKVWNDPKGCKALPVGSHLIFNQTPGTITIYADPSCVIPIEPFARVKPGFGSHVSAAGSFRA